jgi:hypothetical protein
MLKMKAACEKCRVALAPTGRASQVRNKLARLFGR